MALKRFPVPVNSAVAIALAPTLVKPLLDLVTALLTTLELPPKLREMLILLVSHETRCSYEWAQHLPQAAAAGVGDDELALVTDRHLDSADPAERVMLDAARMYLDGTPWEDATMASLLERFPERQVAEILFVLGAIRMFTLYINALDIELDPSGEELAERFADLAETRS
ncbi:alkylhydroperoxidase AhpD family core domain-containing protein [Nonomuraea solani]|uniref:Alkylhydroperoxidase AhpD family core domain-containing protein n=2 Tax=Nonomuraea solani TaxID=1144553 RepID=A0A1H6EPG1_9ACTN|nr:alkylhydroperoxidase AhpD family core domain-containing protein [Nonomuraea solani]